MVFVHVTFHADRCVGAIIQLFPMRNISVLQKFDGVFLMLSVTPQFPNLLYNEFTQPQE